jgi:hypothetical protein
MRPRRQGETGAAKYTHKNPVQMRVGVQRLAVVMPREEQEMQEQQGPDRSQEEQDREPKEKRGQASTPPGEDETAAQASREAGEEGQDQVQEGTGSGTRRGTRRTERAASPSEGTRAKRRGRKDINYKE